MNSLAVFCFLAGIFVGAFAHRDISRGVVLYRESQGFKRVAKQNTPQQNLRMIRVCIAQMRSEYKSYPADHFVQQMLEWCDRVEMEVLGRLEREEAVYAANAR